MKKAASLIVHVYNNEDKKEKKKHCNIRKGLLRFISRHFFQVYFIFCLTTFLVPTFCFRNTEIDTLAR